MSGVSGTRKALRFFISSAGIVRMSSSIHDHLSFAFSEGRSIEQAEKQNRICVRVGASKKHLHTSVIRDQWTDGIGSTSGGAKTIETRSKGLCWMYPAHTARFMISRIRMRILLSVA